MAVASMMRVLSSMPVPDRRLLGGSPRIEFQRLLKAQIPWPQGKTQGIFSIQPFFAKVCLENIREFSCLRMNSLRRQSREFFCQGRELIRRAGKWEGIRRKTDPLAPTHRSRQNASSLWIRKYSTRVA